jgi:hypothetical protein
LVVLPNRPSVSQFVTENLFKRILDGVGLVMLSGHQQRRIDGPGRSAAITLDPADLNLMALAFGINDPRASVGTVIAQAGFRQRLAVGLIAFELISRKSLINLSQQVGPVIKLIVVLIQSFAQKEG